MDNVGIRRIEGLELIHDAAHFDKESIFALVEKLAKNVACSAELDEGGFGIPVVIIRSLVVLSLGHVVVIGSIEYIDNYMTEAQRIARLQ